MVSQVICMILGGGAGSRLYPLTDKRSKPAVPIGAKYRLIDIPISNCLNSGIKRMYVLTQYNSASLNQHIKNTYHFDMFGTAFVDILAAEQTKTNTNWFQGTADAVRQCIHHLKSYRHEYVMILSGDQLYQMKLDEFTKFHVDLDADLTIATLPVNDEDATGFGIMKVGSDNLIKNFIEKPSKEELKNWKSPVSKKLAKKGKDYIASMGIYIFKKQALVKLLEENDSSIDFGKEIIPSAIKNLKVGSYNYDGYWEDIGTVKSFFSSNLELTDNIPKINLFDNDNHIFTRPRQLAPSKLFGTRVASSIIAEGCISHAKLIKKSVIGIRSRIGPKTIIDKAIIFGNDYYETLKEIEVLEKNDQPLLGIGDNCYIHNAIIDKNCTIGSNSTIIGDASLEAIETDSYCIREGIIVVKKGATIPKGSQIGISLDDYKEKTKKKPSKSKIKIEGKK